MFNFPKQKAIYQIVYIVHTQMPPNNICCKFYQELDTKYIFTSFIYDFTKNTALYFTFLSPSWHKFEETFVEQKDRGTKSTPQKFIILNVNFFISIITSYTYISIFVEKQYDWTKKRTKEIHFSEKINNLPPRSRLQATDAHNAMLTSMRITICKEVNLPNCMIDFMLYLFNFHVYFVF